MSPSPKSAPDLVWVYITGAAFVLAIVLAGLFIAFADRLTFVSNAVYYILLMPIALAAAAFLFGAMRSHARYKGQASLGTLQLSGPVVVFALVLLGGLMLANPVATSSLTVRLYGSADRADLVTDGEVVLDLGDDRRTRAVGPDGQVTFAQVPVQFLSSAVMVIPRVRGYRVKEAGPYPVPPTRVVELELERVADSTTVRGAVFDEQGPVADALVNFVHGAVTSQTDANGNFAVVLPYEEGAVVPVTVTLQGRTVYDDNYVVSAGVGLRIAIPDGNRE